MSYIGENVALEQTDEANLADDTIFEPSSEYQGRLVSIAVKNGRQVCWCCFDPVSSRDCADVVVGTAIVRICEKRECSDRVGERNADRAERERKGAIIQLGDLTEPEREQLVDEIERKKRELRGR